MRRLSPSRSQQSKTLEAVGANCAYPHIPLAPLTSLSLTRARSLGARMAGMHVIEDMTVSSHHTSLILPRLTVDSIPI